MAGFQARELGGPCLAIELRAAGNLHSIALLQTTVSRALATACRFLVCLVVKLRVFMWRFYGTRVSLVLRSCYTACVESGAVHTMLQSSRFEVVMGGWIVF